MKYALLFYCVASSQIAPKFILITNRNISMLLLLYLTMLRNDKPITVESVVNYLQPGNVLHKKNIFFLYCFPLVQTRREERNFLVNIQITIFGVESSVME